MQIAPSAIEVIRRLLSENQTYVDENALVPIVTWLFDRQGDEDNPGPVLGLIEQALITDVSADHYSEEGLTVYNGLPDDLREKHADHTLVYTGTNFEFDQEKSPRSTT